VLSVVRQRRFDGLTSGRIPWFPVLGTLFAALLIFSRRPDALLHPQFWADDGSMFYANVYRHGLLGTLLVPQSGYYQDFPVLVAGLEKLVPLQFAPLLGNVIAILVRSLPVGLLLSERATTFAPSLRARGLIAALYICLPGVAETNANVENSLWYLAIAAIIVVISAPPRSRGAKVLDGVILVMCAITGVFAIALAPLLYLYRRWRGRDAVATWVLALFSAAAAIQLFALAYLQHHLPAGYVAGPRIAVPLHPTVPLLFEIIGRRVVMQPLGLDSSTISTLAVELIGVFGALAFAAAIRRGTAEVRLFLLFACAVLAMALAHPLGVSWGNLAAPINSGRYFLIPEYAIAVVVVWHAFQANVWARGAAVALLIFACAIAVPAHWSYPALANHGFAARAQAFERAPIGVRMVFPLNPAVSGGFWRMTLVRQ
jgi:hypothetical protein